MKNISLLAFIVLITIAIFSKSVDANSVTTEECMQVTTYLNAYTPSCDDTNLVRKQFVKFLNLTFYYRAPNMPSDKSSYSLYYASNSQLIIIMDTVGHQDNSPSYYGAYTFMDNATSIQDVACNLTKRDIIPSGYYKATGRNDYRNLLCDITPETPLLSNIRNFDILVNYDYNPACIYGYNKT